jgi:hypothetical protein
MVIHRFTLEASKVETGIQCSLNFSISSTLVRNNYKQSKKLQFSDSKTPDASAVHTDNSKPYIHSYNLKLSKRLARLAQHSTEWTNTIYSSYKRRGMGQNKINILGYEDDG